MLKPDYDTTLARIAGNIARDSAEYLARPHLSDADANLIAQNAVKVARAIVAIIREDAGSAIEGR